jgi:hypothetical protein
LGWRKQANNSSWRWERKVRGIFGCAKQTGTEYDFEDLAMRSSPILALRVDKLAVTQRFAVTIFLNQQAYLWQVINAVSIRHQRPFRAATASDDNAIVFHQGTCP